MKKKQAGILGKVKLVARTKLDPVRATQYRSLVARFNYLTPEGPDFGFATKELARRMAEPGEEDWNMLVHIGKYLAGRPRLRLMFEHQDAPGSLLCYTDSDWAGCPITRRSTSGGRPLRGTHPIRSLSRTQHTISPIFRGGRALQQHQGGLQS